MDGSAEIPFGSFLDVKIYDGTKTDLAIGVRQLQTHKWSKR